MKKKSRKKIMNKVGVTCYLQNHPSIGFYLIIYSNPSMKQKYELLKPGTWSNKIFYTSKSIKEIVSKQLKRNKEFTQLN